MRHLTYTLALLGLTAWSSAAPAARSSVQRVAVVEADLEEVEGRLSALGREYSQRRGLIGAEDARQRFEDAVYSFLVGEFESSALTFYTLVESGALGDTGLNRDAQWYLAESLFEMGNWGTAIDAYGAVMQASEDHPFFQDAVRRQLEVYGLMGDSDGFYRVYRQYILSGRVPATDPVKYTVAKSFYRQGETVRAKAMFNELPADSGYYSRARYFLGTILAESGDLEASLAEFESVVEAQGSGSSTVLQLAQLALGRVHYELGNYQEAVDAYQALPSDSPYFAEQLYELVWTYIKQQDWTSALRHVDIFLIAYPEHRYSLQMKLNQGHLNMKASAFEKALAAYERVVEDYTPLADRLRALEQSDTDPGVFFDGIVSSRGVVGEIDPQTQLPTYAVAMLVDNDTMGRIVGASQELVAQGRDLASANTTLGEISGVLTSSDEAIGTFSRGRQGLLRVRDDSLQVRYRLLRESIVYLSNAATSQDRTALAALEARLDVLAGRSEDLQGVESARSDRYQIYEDQVRAMQEEAGKVSRLIKRLQGEATAIRSVLDEKRRKMLPDEVFATETELDRLTGALNSAAREIDARASSTTLRRIMASIPRGRATDTDVERAKLAGDFDALYSELLPFRARTTADKALLNEVDGLWSRVASVDLRAKDIRAELEVAERREGRLLRDQVRDQRGVVTTLADGVDETEVSMTGLAADITRAGFGRLEDQLSANIMDADMGIVDVYWERKTQVLEKRTELARERAAKLEELNDRFEIIRQKIEE